MANLLKCCRFYSRLLPDVFVLPFFGAQALRLFSGKPRCHSRCNCHQGVLNLGEVFLTQVEGLSLFSMPRSVRTT
jgi:hypothetical protein